MLRVQTFYPKTILILPFKMRVLKKKKEKISSSKLYIESKRGEATYMADKIQLIGRPTLQASECVWQKNGDLSGISTGEITF